MATPIPRWYTLAKAELGTREKSGGANAPKVVQYYQDAVEQKYSDSVAWCAAFVGAMLTRAGQAGSGSLLARSYLTWGEKDNQPSKGTVVVFKRGLSSWQGHVAFYDSDAGGGYIWVIGGNQSDAVTRAKYKKSKVIGYRWPKQVPVPKLTINEVSPNQPQPVYPDGPVVTKKAMTRGAPATAATGMKPQEIMAKAKELYEGVDSTFTIGGTRKAAKTAATLIFYMAKLMVPASDTKALKLPTPRKMATTKKKKNTKRAAPKR